MVPTPKHVVKMYNTAAPILADMIANNLKFEFYDPDCPLRKAADQIVLDSFRWNRKVKLWQEQGRSSQGDNPYR